MEVRVLVRVLEQRHLCCRLSTVICRYRLQGLIKIQVVRVMIALTTPSISVVEPWVKYRLSKMAGPMGTNDATVVYTGPPR